MDKDKAKLTPATRKGPAVQHAMLPLLPKLWDLWYSQPRRPFTIKPERFTSLGVFFAVYKGLFRSHRLLRRSTTDAEADDVHIFTSCFWVFGAFEEIGILLGRSTQQDYTAGLLGLRHW